MKKKLAVMFMLLFALAFAFGALATTAYACPGDPSGPDCYGVCHDNHWDICCPPEACVHSFVCC